MPTSHSQQMNEIVELIALTDPQSLLDIGVGFGKYGVLAREYLELWDGRDQYLDWQRRIDGIEGFSDYKTPIHEFIYDNMYWGDAREIVPKLEVDYDLIILIDILEHFTREEGMKLLEICLQRGRNVLISTPIKMSDQGEAFENPYETHRYQWTRKDFEGFQNRVMLRNSDSLLAYLGEDADRVGRKARVSAARRIKKRYPFLSLPVSIWKRVLRAK